MLNKPDQGDGTYRNPVIYGDYSDPDVIRSGDDYYLISSSFSNAPAIPVLHSYDLVNWKLINYVCDRIPAYRYLNPIHGSGVWAPAIRFHDGWFYVYFPMPDEGIYVSRSRDPAGTWEEPVCILPEAGVIDPCPFFDDDGKAFLITAVAGSRKGYKSVLRIHDLSPDGMRVLSGARILYDGRGTENDTIEGPKVYKRDGRYYIFAPAGGVKGGFQTVLRADNIEGPYEYRVVMRQGNSLVNGPHQGAWVDTMTGEDWFLHFQDVFAGGRIVHLQPMRWQDGWPVIGQAADGEICGEPVTEYRKPSVRMREIMPCEPASSDDFATGRPGLQWQWNANPADDWLIPASGGRGIGLRAIRINRLRQIPDIPNLLLQKWPAPEFVCEIRMSIGDLKPGDEAGIISLGEIFGALSIRAEADGDGPVRYEIICARGHQEFDRQAAFAESRERRHRIDTAVFEKSDWEVFFRYEVHVTGHRDVLDRTDHAGKEVWIRNVPIEEIRMSLMIGGVRIKGACLRFEAKAGRWVGVKNGVFCVHRGDPLPCGSVSVKEVRYS